MLTILHGADFHLDSPFDGLSPEQARARRGEQRELLGRLADLAAERRADLVLLPGDLLDGEDTYYETGELLARALGSIPAPVFIAPGNHDYYGGRTLYATRKFPENVHIFTGEDLEEVALENLNCVVHGGAFTAPYRDSDPLRGFMAEEDGRVHIGILHGDVGTKSRYAPIDEASIAVSGLTYLALGHVHKGSGLQKTAKTYWAYPGCPEGRGFDETGDKGVLVVTVDGASVAAEFVPLAAHRYEILTVDVTDTDPAAALSAALPQNAAGDSYRILLTGESDQMDLKALEGLCAGKFYSLSLRDQTRLRQDIWSRAGEETLTGCFLREVQGRMANADETEKAKLDRALRFGLAALEHREVPQ